MTARAGIIVTGTEVLTGRVADRNGPWLAEQLRQAGVDIAQIIVVGDRPADLRWALTSLSEQGGPDSAGLDLVITSGGLGPTADDLTAAVVGEVQGRESYLDTAVQAHISEILERLSANRGWQLDPAAAADSVRKQAMVPAGASVLPPVGTAPGLVVPVADGRQGPPVVVLPGPPRELQGMWPAVLADPLVQQALADRQELRQQTLRLFGTSESEIAVTLRELESDLDGFDALEITTCLRGGELEIVTRYHPGAEVAYQDLVAAVTGIYPKTLFSTDGRSIDQIVADALLAQNRTIATAESCTAGLLAGRLTDLAGSSAYLRGGLVVYSNEAKQNLAGVSGELINEVGAVSPEVAVELALGAQQRLGADLGVGITGIAGPGGATPGKPVGLVHLCVAGPGDKTWSRRIVAPGSRADVRAYSVAVAMHLIRQALSL